MDGIKFPENVTVEDAVNLLLDACKKGHFSGGFYQGKEYYLCAEGCANGCQVREVLEFLKIVIENQKNKEVKRDARV